MNLPILSTGPQARMTSLEIAELVQSRHDNVKRTIERLAKSGAIRLPPTEDSAIINNLGLKQTMSVYVFEGEHGKRDSFVVVAQLSPLFTAKLVDRWIELERSAIPRTLPEALRLAADLAERVEQQQVRLTVAEPKAAGFDRLTESTGLYSLRDAAKTIGWPERQMTQWLLDHKWIYRGQDGRLQPYAHKCPGHMTKKLSIPRQTSTGEKVFSQPMVTAAGLARLSAIRAKGTSANDGGEGAA